MTGQNRKNQLKALFGTIEQAGEAVPRSSAPASGPSVPAVPTPAKDPSADAQRQRSAAGAVKAMGLSLGGLSREVEEARRLKEALTSAERVLDLDAGLIDTSFVTDRLGRGDDADASFAELVRSIETSGQQVPVLVRPHPDRPGRYQTAYGHRRIRAAERLGRPVRAIVRALSDTELVLAQGKENTERRDLSFIERAFFAQALMERGFERAVVQEALSLHKAEMTRFLQVADAVPRRVADAIGPAPKIGRPRWMAMAELLKGDAAQVKADDEITSARFRAAGSDERFNLLLARLSARTKQAVAAPLEARDGAGRAIARIEAVKGRARVEFLDALGEDFSAYLQAELPALVEAFAAGRKPR
ncbi:MAG: plasmid partitioning protein RepB [Mesorhizobium sp.]|nr:plasmid partitioning protein RepB [Mesorhizobium sp.]MBN9245507.1 plasmid partitioning protein RepB [Mesorhizobium sp.]